MDGHVSVFLPLPGRAPAVLQRFLADPATWLPDAGPRSVDRWGTTVLYRGVRRDVEVSIGPGCKAGSATWRAFSWRPLQVPGQDGGAELPPELAGELALYAMADRSSLVLTASYAALPPGPDGPPDVVDVHRAVESAAQSLLVAVSSRLTPAVAVA